MNVKYENYPTLKQIEEANYDQLIMWINWLPAPLTIAEEVKYNVIIKRKKEKDEVFSA